MPYVLLDGSNNVTALFAQPQDPAQQPGLVQVPDSDARVVAFRAGQTPTQLAAYASVKQATVARGGISVNVAASGSPEMVEIATDPDGCLNLSGAVQLASINPAQTFNWVQASGVVSLNATQILAMGVALGTFVQATYTALGAVLAEIAAATVTTQAQIDAYAWPANS